MSLLSEDQWDYLFPMANSLYDYESFLQAVAKFPMFCGDNDEDLCKRELATFFAHTAHEVGAENPDSSIPTWRQSFYYITEKGCASSKKKSSCNYKTGNSDWASTIWPPVSGQQYYGRGPLQISWNYNYGQLSTTIEDDEYILLNNPDLVQTNGYYAFVSAIWFYMTP